MVEFTSVGCVNCGKITRYHKNQDDWKREGVLGEESGTFGTSAKSGGKICGDTIL